MNAKAARKLAMAIRLMAGAPGSEHVRLQAKLREWAGSLGFVTDLSDLDGKNPDVLRLDNGHLFIGDAKDANHETTANDASVTRFANYFFSFATKVKAGSVAGGFVAIATNAEGAAAGWAEMMSAAARFAGIRRADDGLPVVEKVDASSWIAWW